MNPELDWTIHARPLVNAARWLEASYEHSRVLGDGIGPVQNICRKYCGSPGVPNARPDDYGQVQGYGKAVRYRRSFKILQRSINRGSNPWMKTRCVHSLALYFTSSHHLLYGRRQRGPRLGKRHRQPERYQQNVGLERRLSISKWAPGYRRC